MGILNVTADSFSDGGQYLDPERAIEHGLALAREGADLLDVGGESTRPGAEPVDAEEEARRVVPVVAGLEDRLAAAVGAGGVAPLISVDTRKAAVASRALAAGAALVNDVSAATHDRAMAGVIRDSGAGLVLMHMQGEPRTMQANPHYGDVVREVRDYLAGRVAALVAAGVRPEQLAVDPGIGFGKTLEHNLRLLAGLAELQACGRPVVVGLSRKSWLGRLTGREVGDRGAASLAGMVYAALRGADVVRVHDVRESVDAVRVLAALRGEEPACSG